MATIVALAWRRYLRTLRDRPLRTKAATSSCIAALADVLAQRLTSRAPLNWRRTLAIAAYGALWYGPSAHFWQLLLERVFPPAAPGTLTTLPRSHLRS